MEILGSSTRTLTTDYNIEDWFHGQIMHFDATKSTAYNNPELGDHYCVLLNDSVKQRVLENYPHSPNDHAKLSGPGYVAIAPLTRNKKFGIPIFIRQNGSHVPADATYGSFVMRDVPSRNRNGDTIPWSRYIRAPEDLSWLQISVPTIVAVESLSQIDSRYNRKKITALDQTSMKRYDKLLPQYLAICNLYEARGYPDPKIVSEIGPQYKLTAMKAKRFDFSFAIPTKSQKERDRTRRQKEREMFGGRR